jgi:hypothetical protein
VTPAAYRVPGVGLGFVLARSCADTSCEAVHVAAFAPSHTLDGLTAGVLADEDSRRAGWRLGRCPEHTAEVAS